MTPEALNIVERLIQFTATQNQVADPRRVFNVSPRIAQEIETRVMQSNAFLQQIRNVPVREIKGQILAFDVPGTITKRTRTPDQYGSLRRPVDPTSLIQRNYECHEVEQDSTITWDKIDQWAHLPDFYERYRNMVMFAQARDRLMVMWNGQKVAADTDPVANPYLQDVNEGFFQFMLNELPENVLGANPDGSVKPVKVDAEAADADFRNLDDLVYHLRYEMLHKLFRRRTGLRVLIGDELMVNENTRILGSDSQKTPTERLATDLLINQSSFGRTDVVESDEFPQRGIFLSELSNLSRYWQQSSYRRKLKEDDHEHKGIVDYNFVREDYVIEAAEGCVCVHPDAIHLKDADGNWTPAEETWAVA